MDMSGRGESVAIPVWLPVALLEAVPVALLEPEPVALDEAVPVALPEPEPVALLAVLNGVTEGVCEMDGVSDALGNSARSSSLRTQTSIAPSTLGNNANP